MKTRGSSQKQNEEAWPRSNLVPTYVRCLRLLDLDLRDDWPGITVDTFSAVASRQNLQARIKCVEWSLYRLFELWDPGEARDVCENAICISYS